MNTRHISRSEQPSHKPWVKTSHWIITLSILLLTFTGVEILMVHPRLYWGEVGNELTPALFELPISRNLDHGGWEESKPFFDTGDSPVSAIRTYEIFNQNGWGRSLHFLAAWFLVLTGLVYLIVGIFSGHFKRNIWPKIIELSPKLYWHDFLNHLRRKIPPATGGPQYGLLQKGTYTVIIFIVLPLAIITGFTMSPAITATFPFLLDVFGGYQSARTIHFFASIIIVLFLLMHVVMVIMSGFKQQMRAMTLGNKYEE